MIANNRMPVNATDGISILIGREFFTSQTDTLKDTDIITNHTGLADHRSGAMVDREVMSNPGSRMNINTRFRMSQFCYDTGNIRHTQLIQLMGVALIADSTESRVTENNLSQILCGRIAVIGGFSIRCQHVTQLWQCSNKLF